MSRYKSFPIHEREEFKDECADILNAEWPRSKTARLHVLNKSRNGLPYNIALVSYDDNSREEAVGHSRLSAVQGDEKACFVESVIIKKDLRGTGLGRLLMTETEAHANKLGFTTVYLTTHDHQKFYERVGYDYCEPIVHLGSASAILNNDLMKGLFGEKGGAKSPTTPITQPAKNQRAKSAQPPPPPPPLPGCEDFASSCSIVSNKSEIPAKAPPTPPPFPEGKSRSDGTPVGECRAAAHTPLPPPPPPLPGCETSTRSCSIVSNNSELPARTPPPPPPLPGGKLNTSSHNNKSKTITRIPRSEMSWMKKAIS